MKAIDHLILVNVVSQITFNFERDFSVDATITGAVKDRLQAVTALGQISDKLLQNEILLHLKHDSKSFSKKI